MFSTVIDVDRSCIRARVHAHNNGQVYQHTLAYAQVYNYRQTIVNLYFSAPHLVKQTLNNPDAHTQMQITWTHHLCVTGFVVLLQEIVQQLNDAVDVLHFLVQRLFRAGTKEVCEQNPVPLHQLLWSGDEGNSEHAVQ